MSLSTSIAGWRLLFGRPVVQARASRAFAACRAPGRPTSSQGSSSFRTVASAASVAAPSSTTSTSSESVKLSGIDGLPNVVQVLRERGLVQDVTAAAELEAAAASTCLSVYCGFDPTAESLHLGNLLGIVVLAWFQRCGHRPVALIGGATAAVGDPSGKSAERPVLSEAAIAANTAGISRTLSTLLSPSSAPAAGAAGPELQAPLMLNNLDWFGGMGLLTFLRDVGKYARVGSMVAKESVRRRMESEAGISYTEFTYQLLQGYDFVHLCRSHGVRVQVGGSDQWGNIIAGTDLIRRMLGGPEGTDSQDASAGPSSTNSSSSSSSSSSAAGSSGTGSTAAADGEGEGPPQCFGLTFPLLLKSDGTKFGKSESGAVWLNPDMLSPYQFYQFLFKTADADVCRLLRMLTFLPLEEVAAIEASMARPDYQPNTAQRRLAEEVTRFVHGEEGLQQAIKATQALAPGSTTVLDVATLEEIAGDAPSATLPRAQVVGATLADVMVAAGMQPSKAAVRRMIKGGGVRVNNAKVDDEAWCLGQEDVVGGRLVLLAAGKKNKLLLRVTD